MKAKTFKACSICETPQGSSRLGGPKIIQIEDFEIFDKFL